MFPTAFPLAGWKYTSIQRGKTVLPDMSKEEHLACQFIFDKYANHIFAYCQDFGHIHEPIDKSLDGRLPDISFLHKIEELEREFTGDVDPSDRLIPRVEKADRIYPHIDRDSDGCVKKMPEWYNFGMLSLAIRCYVEQDPNLLDQFRPKKIQIYRDITEPWGYDAS